MLIKLLLMCRETDITCFSDSLDDVKRLFETCTPTVIDFFQRSCFTSTKFCSRIDTLDWHREGEKDVMTVIRNDYSFAELAYLNRVLADGRESHVFDWLWDKLRLGLGDSEKSK